MKMKTIANLLLITLLFSCSASKKGAQKLSNPKDDRCIQAPDPGRCRASFQAYYYDSVENKCKEFIWGGCEGSRPFEFLEECKKACGCDK